MSNDRKILLTKNFIVTNELNSGKMKKAYHKVKEYKSSDKIMDRMIEKYNWTQIIWNL